MRIAGLTIFLEQGYTERTKKIVTRYWDRNDEGLFIEDVASIGEEAGYSPVGLLEYVRKYSTARLQDVKCPNCAGEVYVDCRSSYLKHMRYIQRPCDSCRYSRLEDDEDDVGSSEGVEHWSESQKTGQCSADMEHVLTATPVRVFSGLMIDLANFNASPAEAVAVCQGATLAVVKDGVPLFYCVPLDVMAREIDKGGSTS